MKKLIVFIDGLSDTIVPEGTPLELAKTDNMDELTTFGACGKIQVMPFEVEPDIALMAMLGNNPMKYYTGRGPLESVGFNHPLKPGDLAFRAEFVKLNEKGELISPYTTLKLEQAGMVNETLDRYLYLRGATTFASFDMYGGVVVFSSSNKMSHFVSNTNPYYHIDFINVTSKDGRFTRRVPITKFVKPYTKRILKALPKENSQSSIFSAELVNRFVEESKKMLEKHPVNTKERVVDAILLRDGGTEIPNLKKFNYEVGAIVDEAYEKGIISLMGGIIIPTPLKSKNLKNDYKVRALITLSKLNEFDTIIVTLKGPEYYSMMHDRENKIKAIELIDKYFFGTILNEVDLRGVKIAVSGLRTFSSKFGVPTADPVPFVITGGTPDSTITFNESSTSRGSYGLIRSIDFWNFL